MPLTSFRSGLKLDDALFQRLVESRWEDEQGPGGEGVDCDGFVRIYSIVYTPATTFGRHLRKAAGRGDEELGEETPPQPAVGLSGCGERVKAKASR